MFVFIHRNEFLYVVESKHEHSCRDKCDTVLSYCRTILVCGVRDLLEYHTSSTYDVSYLILGVPVHSLFSTATFFELLVLPAWKIGGNDHLCQFVYRMGERDAHLRFHHIYRDIQHVTVMFLRIFLIRYIPGTWNSPPFFSFLFPSFPPFWRHVPPIFSCGVEHRWAAIWLARRSKRRHNDIIKFNERHKFYITPRHYSGLACLHVAEKISELLREYKDSIPKKKKQQQQVICLRLQWRSAPLQSNLSTVLAATLRRFFYLYL